MYLKLIGAELFFPWTVKMVTTPLKTNETIQFLLSHLSCKCSAVAQYFLQSFKKSFHAGNIFVLSSHNCLISFSHCYYPLQYQKTIEAVYSVENSVETLLDLLQRYREKAGDKVAEKGGSIFTKACFLLALLLQDKRRAEVQSSFWKSILVAFSLVENQTPSLLSLGCHEAA